MSWGDGATFVSPQDAYTSVTGAALEVYLRLDITGSCSGTSVSGLVAQGTANYYMAGIFPSAGYTPSEGYHYSAICAQVPSGGTASFGLVQPTTVLTTQ
jgi:hypothetical protein